MIVGERFTIQGNRVTNAALISLIYILNIYKYFNSLGGEFQIFEKLTYVKNLIWFAAQI